ncbi:MAG TPA: hypothetical protein PLD25_30910 [Chloroflexota bacterium]|nr:hypothetical protein [Chloroflexota bacterium]HUM67598.1 hypothetical protein [Chloroflexota bacterium]
MADALVQTGDAFYIPQWGAVTHLKIYTADYKRLNWVQVWQAFTGVYPGRWAIEWYPPAEELVNDAHVYHLWLLPAGWQPPAPMNLAQR